MEIADVKRFVSNKFDTLTSNASFPMPSAPVFLNVSPAESDKTLVDSSQSNADLIDPSPPPTHSMTPLQLNTASPIIQELTPTTCITQTTIQSIQPTKLTFTSPLLKEQTPLNEQTPVPFIPNIDTPTLNNVRHSYYDKYANIAAKPSVLTRPVEARNKHSISRPEDNDGFQLVKPRSRRRFERKDRDKTVTGSITTPSLKGVKPFAEMFIGGLDPSTTTDNLASYIAGKRL